MLFSNSLGEYQRILITSNSYDSHANSFEYVETSYGCANKHAWNLWMPMYLFNFLLPLVDE